MRTAIVHDWLYTLGGAEKVLAAILRCYPEADLFCLFDVMSESDRRSIGCERSLCSFLQKLPGIGRNHRIYLPLMPLAIEQFDLSRYDTIISSSYAVAKGVLTGPDQLHLSYVHSPMLYAWDLQHQYLHESGMMHGLKGALARLMLHRMRIWDYRTANGVNAYAVNSAYLAQWLKKIYGREATVIHPPVEVPPRLIVRQKEQFFLTDSRLSPCKNIHAIIEAFELLPDERLIVVGSGPDASRLQRIAGPNVFLAGFVPDTEVRALMGSARAFIFAAEEDFGIAPVEAQAEGTPVIALGRGGVRESVVVDGPKPTGLIFDVATRSAIADAVNVFISREAGFRPEHCHAQARQFSLEHFIENFTGFVSTRQAEFISARSSPDFGERCRTSGKNVGAVHLATPELADYPSARLEPSVKSLVRDQPHTTGNMY
jgi:glycosyltransferase involved in cell wall biosynthesis